MTGLLESLGDRQRVRDLIRFMKADLRKETTRANRDLDPIEWMAAVANLEFLGRLREILLGNDLDLEPDV